MSLSGASWQAKAMSLSPKMRITSSTPLPKAVADYCGYEKKAICHVLL